MVYNGKRDREKDNIFVENPKSATHLVTGEYKLLPAKSTFSVIFMKSTSKLEEIFDFGQKIELNREVVPQYNGQTHFSRKMKVVPKRVRFAIHTGSSN